ncbi:MAG: Flp family type IVb pilin [Dichotomicrobium sp.]
MKQQLLRFWRDESGATSIEYGLIAAGIGVAVITLAGQAGDEIQTVFGQIKERLISFNGTAN